MLCGKRFVGGMENSTCLFWVRVVPAEKAVEAGKSPDGELVLAPIREPGVRQAIPLTVHWRALQVLLTASSEFGGMELFSQKVGGNCP